MGILFLQSAKTIPDTLKMTGFFNPLNPKSDKHLISPYNITPGSHIKVMRMKEMIIN